MSTALVTTELKSLGRIVLKFQMPLIPLLELESCSVIENLVSVIVVSSLRLFNNE